MRHFFSDLRDLDTIKLASFAVRVQKPLHAGGADAVGAVLRRGGPHIFSRCRSSYNLIAVPTPCRLVAVGRVIGQAPSVKCFVVQNLMCRPCPIGQLNGRVNGRFRT